MTFDLSCKYDSRQNFYGKAKVEVKKYDNFIAYILYSYGTEVASKEVYNSGLVIYRCGGKYSQTTTRHQKEFFRQCELTEGEIDNLFKFGNYNKYQKEEI